MMGTMQRIVIYILNVKYLPRHGKRKESLFLSRYK